MKLVINYSYDQEKLTPNSYSVYFDEQQIQVDFGSSLQSVAYNLKFTKNKPAYLILNSKQGEMSWNGAVISRHQLTENNTKDYLYLVLQQKPQTDSELNNGTLIKSKNVRGRNDCLIVKYPQGTKALNLN